MDIRENYLLKVDLSGIQDFIFDIPSDGAAKQLKERSFYVFAITKIAAHYFKQLFQTKELYNGGGNLLIYLTTTEEKLQQAILKFQDAFRNESLYPFVAFTKTKNKTFEKVMNVLAAEMQKRKFNRSVSFEAAMPVASAWGDFTNKLTDSSGYAIRDDNQPDGFTSNSITKAGISFIFSSDEKQFEGSILNKLSKNKQGIIDFDTIAANAETRTGTEKLAALKMDVDNLGLLFKNCNEDEFKILSKEIEDFFDRKLYLSILKEYINAGEVYPVFAGGDDCFLVGAWDNIFIIAGRIHDLFNDFQKKLREKLNVLKSPVTLSAGMIVVSAAYPMIRIGEEAENALELAKEAGKDKVTVFGEPLTWQEIHKAQAIALQMRELVINKGESRSLLQRVKQSDIGFCSLQARALNHNMIDFPKVYRLKYYLRNIKRENEDEIKKIFEEYEKAIIDDFMKRGKTNPALFAVAARWAELLTKKAALNFQYTES